MLKAVSESSETSSENNEVSDSLGSLKIIGKITLPDEKDDYENPFEIITPQTLLTELKRAQQKLKNSNLKYIGLKSFVTKVLGNKGYSFGPTYAQMNILRDQGFIEIYDVEDEDSYWPVRAVRVINKP